jgi:hypothetical protein
MIRTRCEQFSCDRPASVWWLGELFCGFCAFQLLHRMPSIAAARWVA